MHNKTRAHILLEEEYINQNGIDNIQKMNSAQFHKTYQAVSKELSSEDSQLKND